jgi:hypothetical protein|tara:strand:- start:15913 stop:16038 length:126 start_codon:yes stop_codon:yes gene_type:complete
MNKLGGGWGLYEPETNVKPTKVFPYMVLTAVLFLALFAFFA